MKVENKIQSTTVGTSELSKSGGAKAAEKSKEKRSVSALEGLGGGAAKTSISAQAKEASKAFATAVAAPDVREDRVAELKKKIQAGTYKINADLIADKLVDDHMALGAASEG
jgi:negative regulator of flagellin synthesis FlgM